MLLPFPEREEPKGGGGGGRGSHVSSRHPHLGKAQGIHEWGAEDYNPVGAVIPESLVSWSSMWEHPRHLVFPRPTSLQHKGLGCKAPNEPKGVELIKKP